MVTKNAQTHILIGTTVPADTVAEYEADSFTEIGGIYDLGEFGDTFEEVTTRRANEDRVVKLKSGFADGGTLNLIVETDNADAGQTALADASKDRGSEPYSFMIQLPDAPEGGTPTTFYFKAMVLGSRTAFGQADSIIRTTYPLSITSEVLEVPAADAAA